METLLPMEENESMKLSLEQFNEVSSWTDEEWLKVLENCPPDASVDFGIEFVRKLRDERKGTGVTPDSPQN